MTLHERISQLRSVTCHMGSPSYHAVRHKWTPSPSPNPARQACSRLTYSQSQRYGRLSWPRWLGRYWDGLEQSNLVDQIQRISPYTTQPLCMCVWGFAMQWEQSAKECGCGVTDVRRRMLRSNLTWIAFELYTFVQYKCCGVSNYTDWSLNDDFSNSSLPDSCCKNETESCGKDVLNKPEPEDRIYMQVSYGCCYEAS